MTPIKPSVLRALVVEPAHDALLSALIPAGEVVVSRFAAANAHALAERFTSTSADIVILRTPTQSPESIAELARLRPDIPIVVVCDQRSTTDEDLLRAGAEDVLMLAGMTPSHLMGAIRHAIARHQGRPAETANPKEPDERAIQRHRLEMVGRLAGNVAHDFNNLLLVISGETERLVEGLPAGDPLKASADAVAQAASRAALLTEQLLAFGRRQVLIAQQVDVSHVVADAGDLLREAVGEGVVAVTDLAPNLPHVRVDRARLEQVLVNLATNARDAMNGGGTLTIATDLVEADEAMREGRPWLPAGAWVRLRVIDTGTGIPAEVMPHMFEPFFTTKDPTPGSGLGLSTVYGIVKQSGGFVWVENHANAGAIVTILLPPVPAPAAPLSLAAAAPAVETRVLLVDDEEAVRELLLGVLEKNGFEVTSAGTAEEAMRIASTAAFDILLTDVVLPGLSGPDLARQVRAHAPATRVLFMSGYTGDGLLDAQELSSEVAFIQKPFGSKALVAELRSLLAQQVPPSRFSTFVARD